jgi:hypothetical protein
MALFPSHRKADRDDADCQTRLLIGAASERPCVNDRSLLGFGSHALLSGRFRDRATYAMCGVQTWRLGGVQTLVEEIMAHPVVCLTYKELSEWHLGEIASCQTARAEAISLARELNDMSSLAFALYFVAGIARFERNPAEVERLTSDLIELSTRYNFAFWLPGANVLCGWARSASATQPKAFRGLNRE